jgi:hypothetical protein
MRCKPEAVVVCLKPTQLQADKKACGEAQDFSARFFLSATHRD